MTQKAKTLSCAEFQEQLPELFASGSEGIGADPSLQAHLDSCDNCSALVRDLQYIADQARKLLEPVEEEPSEDVWQGIQTKLKSEPKDRGPITYSVAPSLPS
jgi:hypothetical protein